MTGITDKSYLHVHNNDYENKRRLHLNRSKCSLNYKRFHPKTKICAGRTPTRGILLVDPRYSELF